MSIIIIINSFVWRRKVVTSEALSFDTDSSRYRLVLADTQCHYQHNPTWTLPHLTFFVFLFLTILPVFSGHLPLLTSYKYLALIGLLVVLSSLTVLLWLLSQCCFVSVQTAFVWDECCNWSECRQGGGCVAHQSHAAHWIYCRQIHVQ